MEIQNLPARWEEGTQEVVGTDMNPSHKSKKENEGKEESFVVFGSSMNIYVEEESNHAFCWSCRCYIQQEKKHSRESQTYQEQTNAKIYETLVWYYFCILNSCTLLSVGRSGMKLSGKSYNKSTFISYT